MPAIPYFEPDDIRDVEKWKEDHKTDPILRDKAAMVNEKFAALDVNKGIAIIRGTFDKVIEEVLQQGGQITAARNFQIEVHFYLKGSRVKAGHDLRYRIRWADTKDVEEMRREIKERLRLSIGNLATSRKISKAFTERLARDICAKLDKVFRDERLAEATSFEVKVS